MDRWGEAKVQQAPDVPVTNTFPQVEVCSPWGCVAAGKLCNEQKAGSLPDQIPTQPHIYRAFQKCSAYQWVLLTCWSRQQECRLCLVRCAVNRLLRQEYLPVFFICNTLLCSVLKINDWAFKRETFLKQPTKDFRWFICTGPLQVSVLRNEPTHEFSVRLFGSQSR